LVWDPLLRAKFGSAAETVPAAWMWGRFQQRAGARQGGKERLGYLRGGFRQLFEALEKELVTLGVDVRLDTEVSEVVIETDSDGPRVTGVRTSDGVIDADEVLFTAALPAITRLVPAPLCDPRWSSAAGLGVQCVVLELDRPLTDKYWINVCDPRLPFGGIIEHTNMLPSADYGGRHVVYLSRYFTHDEPLATSDPATEAVAWVDALARHFARFDPASVLAVHPFKTMYAAPLVTLGYRAMIPPARTHIRGLNLSTTAQIYPQDRGMNEAVRTGVDAADAIVGDSRR
jgi:protoporphyrinogen oxidase